MGWVTVRTWALYITNFISFFFTTFPPPQKKTYSLTPSSHTRIQSLRTCCMVLHRHAFLTYFANNNSFVCVQVGPGPDRNPSQHGRLADAASQVIFRGKKTGLNKASFFSLGSFTAVYIYFFSHHLILSINLK